jgi:hypothetical protein
MTTILRELFLSYYHGGVVKWSDECSEPGHYTNGLISYDEENY